MTFIYSAIATECICTHWSHATELQLHVFIAGTLWLIILSILDAKFAEVPKSELAIRTKVHLRYLIYNYNYLQSKAHVIDYYCVSVSIESVA